jgi:hypothetical protein
MTAGPPFMTADAAAPPYSLATIRAAFHGGHANARLPSGRRGLACSRETVLRLGAEGVS